MKTSLKLAVAIASAVALASGASYAFDLGEEENPNTYAQEINYDSNNGGVVLETNNRNSNQIRLLDGIGFGVSIGEKVYIRYDLSNATFQTQMTSGNGRLRVGGGGVGHTEVVVDGGSAESTCVVYEVAALGAAIPQDADVRFRPIDLNILDNFQPVTATYNLFSSAPNAACFKPAPITPELTATVSGEIYEFGPSLGLNIVEIDPAFIAEVDTLFTTTDNADGDNDPVNAQLAAVTLELNPVRGADTTLVAPGDITDGNTFTVAGDFTAANLASGDETVTLNDVGCGVNGVGVLQADLSDPQSAVFEDLIVTTAYFLCYAMLDDDNDDQSDNPIADSEYVGSIVADAIAGVTIASIASAEAGEIDRNGTVLRVPYFSKHVADSNYVSIANMGSTDAVYSTTCYSKIAGNDPLVGLVGQPIAAQRTKNLFFSNMCPSFLPNFYDAIEITVTTASGNVVGSLVRVDTSTGEAEYSYITNNENGE